MEPENGAEAEVQRYDPGEGEEEGIPSEGTTWFNCEIDQDIDEGYEEHDFSFRMNQNNLQQKNREHFRFNRGIQSESNKQQESPSINSHNNRY